MIIDKEALPSGRHTWSCHDADIPREASWLRELASATWPSYEVIFPSFRRQIDLPYLSFRSVDLQKAVFSRPNVHFQGQSMVKNIANQVVTLDSGQKLKARTIISATGWRDQSSLKPACGYQKFLGQFIRLKCPPKQTINARIMDACLSQENGFHFMYVLPFSRDFILLEDTYYNDDPCLDKEGMRKEIENYCSRNAWEIKSVEHSEEGVLALPFYPNHYPRSKTFLEAGVSQGLFHPTTGYSLPMAIRYALSVSQVIEQPLSAQIKQLTARQVSLKKGQSYFYFLNRLLFVAARPDERWQIFRRFYRFKKSYISRFYKGQLSHLDQLKMFLGKPPIPTARLLKLWTSKKT